MIIASWQGFFDLVKEIYLNLQKGYCRQALEASKTKIERISERMKEFFYSHLC